MQRDQKGGDVQNHVTTVYPFSLLSCPIIIQYNKSEYCGEGKWQL